ncbi:hypothetical protein HHE01_11520 [Helicobacter heilmannii]|uniref:Uncharacterized protein n=1 Tax=Helicobacter heilmannii TaxID=35817 RepID=A0A0K2Y586_HELHE|nr:hypothetical protein HHE01_11520 [Helicobacter heilmannii]
MGGGNGFNSQEIQESLTEAYDVFHFNLLSKDFQSLLIPYVK